MILTPQSPHYCQQYNRPQMIREKKTSKRTLTTTTTTTTRITTTTLIPQQPSQIFNFQNMLNLFGDYDHSDIILNVLIPASLSSLTQSGQFMMIDGCTSGDSSSSFNSYNQVETVKICEFRVSKILLASSSTYFSNLFHYDTLKNGSNNNNTTIDLQLDIFRNETTVFIEKIMEECLRLFYVNFIDDKSFKDYNFVYENILYLQQLAIYFSFDSLIFYTNQKIMTKFSIDYFPIICEYCIEETGSSSTFCNDNNMQQQQQQQQQQPSLFYSVRCNEKAYLFEKLMAWFEYCTDDFQFSDHFLTASSSFFRNVLLIKKGYRRNGNSNEADDQEEEANIFENHHNPAIQQRRRRRHSQPLFLSKKTIIDCLRKNISNFSQFESCGKICSYQESTKFLSTKGYTRICIDCINSRDKWQILKGYSIIPFHIITYHRLEDDYDISLQFRLKVCQSNLRSCIFDIVKKDDNNRKQRYSPKENIECIVVDENKYDENQLQSQQQQFSNNNHLRDNGYSHFMNDNNKSIFQLPQKQQSYITLFTKEHPHNTQQRFEQPLFPIKTAIAKQHKSSIIEPVIEFILPPQNECYISKCETCCSSLNPTYVIQYNVTLSDKDIV